MGKCLFLNRTFLLILAFSCGWAVTAFGQVSTTSAVEPADGHFTIQFDNDAYHFTCYLCGKAMDEDRDYTMGGVLRYARPLQAIAVAPAPLRIARHLGNPDRVGWLLGLGLEMYTPTDLVTDRVQPNDRPYAGWSHLDFGLRMQWTGGTPARGAVRMAVGAIGPGSQMGTLQRVWHRWRREGEMETNPYLQKSPNPNGWGVDELSGDQTRVAVQLDWDHEREIVRTGTYAGMRAVVSGGGVATIGTLRLAGGLSATVRAGKLGQTWPIADPKDWDLFFFATTGVQASVLDRFFEGGGGRYAPNYPVVLATSAGLAFHISRFHLAWSVQSLSKQAQRDPDLPADSLRYGKPVPRGFLVDHLFGRITVGVAH